VYVHLPRLFCLRLADEFGLAAELKGPHGDVDKVKEFLLQKGNFREEDIVVMKDADGIQANLRPYRNNIVRPPKLSRLLWELTHQNPVHANG